MSPSLLVWIFRILRGEKFRKTTREDYKHFSGFFVLTPVFFYGFLLVADRIRTNNALLLWLMFTAYVAISYFGCMLWSTYVPVRKSYLIGTILWVAAYVMAFCLF